MSKLTEEQFVRCAAWAEVALTKEHREWVRSLLREFYEARDRKRLSEYDAALLLREYRLARDGYRRDPSSLAYEREQRAHTACIAAMTK